MNGFIVSVKGDKRYACYTVETVEEAITKAESIAPLGAVSILDPKNREYAPFQFHELQERWSRTKST